METLAIMLVRRLAASLFWLAAGLVWQLLLVFLLTMLWRGYKTSLVRKVALLRRLQLKRVEARQAVLITGASSGIGLALAKHLHKVGYSVIATYFDQKDPGYDELKKLQQQDESSAPGGRNVLLLYQLDVTSEEQVRQLYERLTHELESHKLHLYALVNNAGLGSLQPFAWLQRRAMLKLIETNISGALLMTREFLPLLIKSSQRANDDARLLFVSSGLGFVPGATYATYGLTKSAHLYFSRCMNLELRKRYGVKSVAVVPHNFIKNTNICASNVQQNQRAWDELKPLERELYAREHDEQLELVRSLEKATQNHAKLYASAGHHREASKTHNQSSNASWPSHSFKTVLNFFNEVSDCLQGKNLVTTLETSGALECFEDALRLRDPPEQIFAGDSKFQLIIGTLLLLLPNSCLSLLSSSVAPSLYK